MDVVMDKFLKLMKQKSTWAGLGAAAYTIGDVVATGGVSTMLPALFASAVAVLTDASGGRR